MTKICYLDNAATSFPKPGCVIRKCTECLNFFCVNPGRGAHRQSLYASSIMFKTREALCDLFGADNPERIAFTMNTTQSINFALKGILQKGDHVIITAMEHNSVLRPLHSLLQKGIEYDIAPLNKNREITFDEIKPFIKHNTKLVCMIHSSNVTGRIFDVGSIGQKLRDKNIIFMVDAAQTAGKIPIDIKKMGVDVLCFPGHKGLFSPPGCAGIYIDEKINIRSVIEGGTGSYSESRAHPNIMPDILESGTQNILGISGLYEGVRFAENHLQEIKSKEKFLTDRLYSELRNLSDLDVIDYCDENSGIISIVPKGKTPSEVAFLLDRDYSIAVRAGFHCCPLACKSLKVAEKGTLRFSPGFFSSIKDIDKTCYALKKILSISY